MDSTSLIAANAEKRAGGGKRRKALDSPKTHSRAHQAESDRSTSTYNLFIEKPSKPYDPTRAPPTRRRVIERPAGGLPPRTNPSATKPKSDPKDCKIHIKQRNFALNHELPDIGVGIVCPTPIRPMRPSPILERPMPGLPSIFAPIESDNLLPSLLSDLSVSPSNASSGPTSPSNSQGCFSMPTTSVSKDANHVQADSQQNGYFSYFSTHKSWPLPETALTSPTGTSYDYPSTTYTLWPACTLDWEA